MRIKQHQKSLPVCNLDIFEDQPEFNKNGDLFPANCRFLIVGPSGCGKSNALLSLLFHPNGLKFENVYIFSKSLYQPKYQLLEEVLNGVHGIGYHSFRENDEIIDTVDAKENSIFIFDDICNSKQDKIRSYYSMGRHKKIDVAFLCQTYVSINKHLIRDNANIIVVFRSDDVNLHHIFNEHISPDMSYEKFKEICSVCWSVDNYGFLMIVKDFNLNNGRYRHGFDKFISIKEN